VQLLDVNNNLDEDNFYKTSLRTDRNIIKPLVQIVTLI